jgi:hypothetical protein
MTITEKCIDEIKKNLSVFIDHTFYSTLDAYDSDEPFEEFMEILLAQFEHIICKHLITTILGKPESYLKRYSSQPETYDVQKLIKKYKEKS